MICHSNIKYLYIGKERDIFEEYANRCFEEIIKENLRSKGGMLIAPRAIWLADFLLIVTDKTYTNCLGIAAVNKRSNPYTFRDELYITQIAVKNDYKRLGIGKSMVQELIDNHNCDITCQINDFNTVSQVFFTNLGFEAGSGEDHPYFYRRNYYKSLKKTY